MQKIIKGKSKGFTLIELLVVIAIIAILSTVVMAGLNSARQKGRDANRVAATKQVQAALELYSDSCGGYPPIGPISNLGTGLQTTTAIGCPGGTTFASFMSVLPVNPGPGGTTYQYCGTTDGTSATCLGANGTSGSLGYRYTFTLEGQSGSLALGLRTATPSGIQ